MERECLAIHIVRVGGHGLCKSIDAIGDLLRTTLKRTQSAHITRESSSERTGTQDRGACLAQKRLRSADECGCALLNGREVIAHSHEPGCETLIGKTLHGIAYTFERLAC